MEAPVKTIKFSDGSTVEIYQDDNPQNPRTEWDNVGQMICFHKRYNLGDKHEYRADQFNDWDAIEEQLRQDFDIALIFPLYLYDHSGITISVTPFSCPWDSGQIGFIFVTKQAIRQNWCWRITKKALEQAKTCLLSEVKVYDAYLRGAVYGFVHKRVNGEEIDSCWGFYGDDFDKNGMLLELGLSEAQEKEFLEQI